MITKYQKKYSVWLDLNLPTRDEIEIISKDYNLDPSIADDLLNPTPKQKVSLSGALLYVVIHIPVFKHSHSGIYSQGNEQEIDFVIGRKMLITIHYDTIDAIYKYSKAVEVKEMLEREEGGNHAFVEIMIEIYKSLFDELAYIEDQLREIEKKIFQEREKEMVLSISNIGRNLLNFRRIIELHGEILEELKMLGTPILGKKFDSEINELILEWQRLSKSAENHTAFIHELRETNNSLLSTKQNEIMKMLTVLAFLTLPASLIASIFNMSTSLPLVGEPYDFEIVISMMIFASACMFLLFKYKKWL